MIRELTDAWNLAALQRAEAFGIPTDLLHSEWRGMSNVRRTNKGTLVQISFADGRTPLCEAPEDEWRTAIQASEITHPYARAPRDIWKLQQAKEAFIKAHPLSDERALEVISDLEAKGQICTS